ncbi:MAG: tripartite tricarboxylate transporter substrate binding protein [Alphaproteobacteria bacterium]|nr:tripartite tricarboxylate transporter substrate binding protein [Alphaproteobacteria bacterium]
MAKNGLKMLLTAGAFALAGIAPAKAEFPERQVQVIFPWSPGVAYAVSQVVADRMGKELGQTMPVNSVTGASGVKAALNVLNSPANGYKVFDGYVAPILFAPLLGKTPFQCEDFEPLYGVGSNGFAIGVRKDDDRFPDLPALISMAKENPGTLKYSGAADISIPHMVAALMLKNANAPARSVPYNDTGEGWKDFISGELDFMVLNSGNYKANKDDIRVLAVMSDRPMSENGIPGPLPKDYGIELGVEGLAAVGWNWWVVKKGTPPEALDKLRSAMKAALDDPATQQKINDLGFTPLPPETFNPGFYTENCRRVRSQLEAGMEAIKWEKEVTR